MNSIRSYSVRSLRSKGELSLKIFPGSPGQRHCRRAAWGESNRSGPIRARDSEVRTGLYVMVGDGMDGKVTDMQAWGDLRENQSRSGRGPEGSGSAVFRRSRSPHKSDDAGKAMAGSTTSSTAGDGSWRQWISGCECVCAAFCDAGANAKDGAVARIISAGRMRTLRNVGFSAW